MSCFSAVMARLKEKQPELEGSKLSEEAQASVLADLQMRQTAELRAVDSTLQEKVRHAGMVIKPC